MEREVAIELRTYIRQESLALSNSNATLPAGQQHYTEARLCESDSHP